VIVAHQLLKNDIDQHEYWLVTDDLLSDGDPADLPGWIRWDHGAQQTAGGEVRFRYALLSELRRNLEPTPLPDLELPRRTKMFSATREYGTHIIALFHATGDPSYRTRWQEGVVKIEEVDHHLPRVGMRSRHITEDGEVTVYASSYAFRPDRIEFSETDEEKSTASYFTLERLDGDRTRLTVDVYARRSPMKELLFRMTRRRRMQAALNRSLLNLDRFVQELDVPAEY
jgi:hypothetical protein